MTTSTTTGPGILVLGATGKTGRRVAARLRALGLRVRAASRTADVRFDWTEPATWGPALDGADRVYLVPPDDPAPTAAFVRAAEDAGVRRFVLLSGRGAEHFGAGFGAGMAEAERAVRGSGAAWTVLRPNNFDQNFDEDLWHAPLAAGRLGLPAGAVPEPFVDVEDVADVAVAALTGDGHGGRVYELSGPRGLSFGQAVAEIAAASGREIRFEELSPQQYRAELLASGVPAAAADSLVAMFALHEAGLTARPATGVRDALGRDPVDFADWARRAAAAGAWSGAPV
ncbi:NAD(P)H-binding protein [Allonocardiopsis opalescens]|uniref:Uncharacterized protein YbjT (DUF2867 family) n=1 Tax=Allonocardiopsis opalescens TaxID=1144618 RepID=A0A2T0PZB5_9ACTN|nr:NAD(P)H-binding protein [Allonocardiopsis opalescens]PRX96779.1 uncharacterized protein YbjT (DUF2867 family) [Allonocardiopsis opalescens]